MTDKEINRFWSKVDIKENNECWNWLGYTSSSGYGKFRLDYKSEFAHRIAYRIHTKKVIFGNLMHTCDNPRCVNPHHLREGSHCDNMSDMCFKDRQNNRQGENNSRAILTEKDVIKIRKLRKQGYSNIELGISYKVNPNVISKVCTGRTWNHI